MTRQPHFRPLAAASSSQMRTAVARVLTCEAIGKITKQAPIDIKNRNWPGDVLTEQFYDPMYVRSASVPASTSGWGQQLLPTVVGGFLSGLAPQSAAVRLFERAVRLDFDGVYQFSVPRASVSAEPVFVAEGSPTPISEHVFDAVTVGPTKKMLLGAAITAELEFYAAESASAIIERVMSDQAGKSLDAAVFSDVAADALRPAGLLNGVTPITGTAGGDLVAMIADLRAIVAALADGGCGGDNVVFVCHPSQAIALRALASPAFSYEVFSTTAVAAGTVIGLAPDAIASGYSGLPQIDVSKDATAHFEDTTPLAIGVAGSPNVVSAPVRSAWQQNLLMLRLRLNCAWASLVPGTTTGAVAVVTGATW
jgi:hypothetical protein